MSDSAGSSLAPASPAQSPLERFVGKWATNGVVRSAGQETTGRMQATDTYEWLPGGHFLVHRWDARLAQSRTQGIEIIGYDAACGDFLMRSFDSDGNTLVMRAAVEGDDWTFSSDALRFTGGFSDGGATFSGLWEQRSGPGSSWVPWMDITLRKAG